MISTKRQFFVLLKGLVSIILTVSPMLLVLFVLSVQLGSLIDKFTVKRVLYLPFDSNRYGLLHFVADHNTYTFLSQISSFHLPIIYFG
jgi:hypothetical protein